MTVRFLFLLLSLFILSACQRQYAKEPLAISGKLFIFNYRIARATYVITLSRNGPLPDESYVETQFENPVGGAPISTRSKIFPFWDKVSLESPPVHCVVKNRPYRVAIRIVDGGGTLLQSIETTVTSSLDQTILPAKPLVTGAAYDRNPAVFKPDGSADFSPEKDCPAR